MCIAHPFRITGIFISLFFIVDGCSSEEIEDQFFRTGHLIRFTALPPELNENSGMIWYNGYLWTINDSGGDPFIFIVDTATGNIIRHIELSGAENVDWEEITQDESYVYVGDIGNNAGDRKDLRIYKISKSDLHKTIVVPEIIEFGYADQTDYAPALYNTPFDCEAMISAGDTLYLFTKNWTGSHTSIYAIPAQQGNYMAANIGTLKVGGQITASSYTTGNKCLYLLGYKDYIPFLWILNDYVPEKVYNGRGQKYVFAENMGLQTEGITVPDHGDILISCEKGYGSPAIYKVKLGN